MGWNSCAGRGARANSALAAHRCWMKCRFVDSSGDRYGPARRLQPQLRHPWHGLRLRPGRRRELRRRTPAEIHRACQTGAAHGSAGHHLRAVCGPSMPVLTQAFDRGRSLSGYVDGGGNPTGLPSPQVQRPAFPEAGFPDRQVVLPPPAACCRPARQLSRHCRYAPHVRSCQCGERSPPR